MRSLVTLLLLMSLVAGCGGPKSVENLTPISDEEKAKIAKETKEIEDEESPKNKTRVEKKKR